MVYNPLETPLLKLAKERGIPTISGMEMFVQQGARQFEIWTGKPAPEAEMLRVVELELRALLGLRSTTGWRMPRIRSSASAMECVEGEGSQLYRKRGPSIRRQACADPHA
jgi:hypothetical protein